MRRKGSAAKPRAKATATRAPRAAKKPAAKKKTAAPRKQTATQTFSPPVTETLTADDLVGAWKGAGRERISANGRVKSFTDDPTPGVIMYSPDGVMMVLSTSDARVPKREPASLSEAQLAKVAAGTTAYYGRYSVKKGVLLHDVEVGLFPAWVGQSRTRYVLHKGRKLTYTTPPEADGTYWRIFWERITPRRRAKK